MARTGGLLLAVLTGMLLVATACGADTDTKAAGAAPGAKKGGNPVVMIKTSKGVIQAELFADAAPKTVENFLGYADEGFYDGLIFHRVIDGFMIQGGGFDPEMRQKRTRDPIVNEADNGKKNLRGTLAMARTSDVNSATAQFFINLKDNDFLDHGTRDFGYAVFGRVTDGMDVVDAIGGVETGFKKGHGDVPQEPVVIESIRRAE